MKQPGAKENGGSGTVAEQSGPPDVHDGGDGPRGEPKSACIRCGEGDGKGRSGAPLGCSISTGPIGGSLAPSAGLQKVRPCHPAVLLRAHRDVYQAVGGSSAHDENWKQLTGPPTGTVT